MNNDRELLGRTRQTLWGGAHALTQKTVAKRNIIAQKFVPLCHDL